MIPPSTTITDSGRRTRRTLLWLGALALAVNLVVVIGDSLTSGGSVSGPTGSSFVTTSDGAAALGGTLERLGTSVVRSRAPLDETPLDRSSTLVAIEVAGTAYSASELRAVEEFLLDGGRLVVVGSGGLVGRLVEEPPQWRSAGSASATPVTELALDRPIEAVALSGFGSLVTTGADLPLLAAGDRVIAAARPLGDGLIVWMADSAPYLNSGVGLAGSAQWAVATIGPGRSVVFDELRHGFSQEGGFWQILPAGWRTALVLGAFTLGATLVAYGRRFGPPQDDRRRLPPGRALYLHAVAGLLSRSSSPADAVEVVRDEARRRLEKRAGDGGDLAATAAAAGLDDSQIQAVLGTGSDEATLVAVDRALATLSQERR